MTRKEAEEILNNTKHVFRDIHDNYPILDGLEALGLIKFDKPEKLDEKLERILLGIRINGRPVIEFLAINNLKIVEKVK